MDKIIIIIITLGGAVPHLHVERWGLVLAKHVEDLLEERFLALWSNEVVVIARERKQCKCRDEEHEERGVWIAHDRLGYGKGSEQLHFCFVLF
jgi:hypothetical protein